MTYTHTLEHSLQQLLLAWHTRRESTTPADTLYNDTVGGTNTHTNTHTQYYHNSVSISINGTIRVCVPVNTLLNPTHTHTLAQIPLIKQHRLEECTAKEGEATAPEYLHGNRLESSISRSAYCQRLKMNPVLIMEAKPHNTHQVDDSIVNCDIF